MVSNGPRHATGYLSGGRQMEKLIGTVGIGMRPEDPGDEELCLREALSEHAHERDRAPDPHKSRRLAKPFTRSAFQRSLEPQRQWWGVPSSRAPISCEGDFGAVRG